MFEYFRIIIIAFFSAMLLFSGCAKNEMRDISPKANNKSQDRLAPDIPPQNCPPEGCLGTSSGDPSNTLTFSCSQDRGSFVSQENPGGNIVDLVVIDDRTNIPRGYYFIDKNLNEGCSGFFSNAEIYMVYTRDPAAARRVHNNHSAYRAITQIKAFTELYAPSTQTTIGGVRDGYEDIWAANKGLDVRAHDLNCWVGGKTIWGGQKCEAAARPIEVGIVRGLGSSNPQLPIGWVRDRQDLNEGAGGEYVYFCYKQR